LVKVHVTNINQRWKFPKKAKISTVPNQIKSPARHKLGSFHNQSTEIDPADYLKKSALCLEVGSDDVAFFVLD
jgi:hypothetical protein